MPKCYLFPFSEAFLCSDVFCLYTLQRIVIPSAANRCILCSEPPLTTFAIEKAPLTFDMAEWPKESLE